MFDDILFVANYCYILRHTTFHLLRKIFLIPESSFVSNEAHHTAWHYIHNAVENRSIFGMAELFFYIH